MKVGFATVDITPPLGSESPGSFRKRYFYDVRDPLHAKAMLIDDGDTTVAMVGLDSLSVKASVVREARELAHKWCGIAPEHIMVGASHTHHGGPATGHPPSFFDQASDPEICHWLIRESAIEPDPNYLELLARQIASAVAIADKHKAEALLAVGLGREEGVSFNRRFKMKNGRQMTHPGKGNPDIVAPAGPIDPEVGVISAWTADEEFLGCVVNFACHGTTMGCAAFSADWPYFLDRTIRRVMGMRSTVVFLNGACGDISQVDNLSMRERESGEYRARHVGQRVGAEALKVLSEAEPAELRPLAASRCVLELNTRKVPRERLARALKLVKSSAERDYEWRYARDIILLVEKNKIEPLVQCELQVIQIGPLAVVSNPAEYFCQLGLDIKRASPFPYTFVVELANGCIGYVPTEDAMGPHGGGYEPRMAMSSRLAAEAGAKIRDASIELLKQLTPGPVPPRRGVQPRAHWGMGSSGPEEV